MEELEQLDWASKFFLKISGAALAVIIFGLVLAVTSGSNAIDQSGNTNISVNVPVSCNISSTAASYNISMTAGTLNSNIGSTKINAYCNDNNGYVIYTRGAGTGTDKSDMVSSIGPSYNIKTGTATSGSTSAWAMKVTAGTGTTPPTIQNNFDSFHTVPTDYTAVAIRQSSTEMSTDTSTSGSYITALYQVYLANTQPAGSYTGKVMYAMLHPSTSANLVSLEDAIEAANALVPGTVGTITKDGVAYYKMQDLTTTICNNANILGEASQLQMIDSRDNSLYYVTKLQDGQCWMTQNLDLDLVSNNDKALTSNDTNLKTYGSKGYDSSNGYTCSNDATDCTGGVISWVPERSTSTALSDWKNDNSNPYSYDRGEAYPDGTNTHKLAGNYYNWTAAIASNNSSSFNASTYYDTTANPKNSVCPKNWRLPVIADYTQYQLGDNEFYNLDYYYNSGATNTATGLMSAPLYFARSGDVNGGSLGNSGSSGCYWSSTVYDSSHAYYLYFRSGDVNPTLSYGYRNFGFSVRCVLDT